MKDYYQILGVSEQSSQEEIRSAFRKLAFQHHPDTASGDKKRAEERFKEINEAYGVIGDGGRRQQYDSARRAGFASDSRRYGGSQTSQQDIFRDIFSNPAMYTELNRMFHQAGLRFDQSFLNTVFFRGGGTFVTFSAAPWGVGRQAYRFGGAADERHAAAEMPRRQLNWLERFLNKITVKLWQVSLRRLFGLRLEPPPGEGATLDRHMDLEISPDEARRGGEKVISQKRGWRTTKLVVKIPPGVRTGTRIRLRGAGISRARKRGELYLTIKVKDARG